MKRKYIISLFFAFLPTLFLFTGCSQKQGSSSPSGSGSADYRQISSGEAAAMMETEDNYIILDVRTSEEYQEGHIPNAINIPNETIQSEKLAELPDKEQLIFVYCRSGNRSKQASQKLADAGYTNIAEFGGINEWHGDIVK
nr:rhodanese-like domain-containing protein [uncultured Faecalimonas sp.]